MLFQTTTQFVVLALMLVAGFIFGLAARSGGRKWRRELDAERATHVTAREQLTTRLRETERQLAESQRRVHELEARTVVTTREVRAQSVAHPAGYTAPDGTPSRGSWMGTGPAPTPAPDKR